MITQLRTESRGPLRHQGMVEIPCAEPDVLRHDPVVHRAYQRLAVKVFAQALEDLATEHHQTAWEFLMANPDGLTGIDVLFCHWWGFLRGSVGVAQVRRTAVRARRLARADCPYVAATIWRDQTWATR